MGVFDMKQLSLVVMVCSFLGVARCDVTAQSEPTLKACYRVIVSPNPKWNTGVMAIVPISEASKNKSGSLVCASTAFQNIRRVNRFNTTQIFVFKSLYFASRFRQYQNQRKGAPLTEKDYRQLTHLWKDVPVCAFYAGKKSTFYYPANNPSDWWKPLVQKPKNKTATTQ